MNALKIVIGVFLIGCLFASIMQTFLTAFLLGKIIFLVLDIGLIGALAFVLFGMSED